MSTSTLPNIPSFRKQQLHLEFSRLKAQCPDGIYLSFSAGDPTLWSGVLFVRTGPYASAVLRLQITFPDTYPDRPPVITFLTEIFHPLVVPLTTHTFSTGSVDPNQTVIATDAWRLPPGSFSLRDGFPSWFGWSRRGQDGLAIAGRGDGNTPERSSKHKSTSSPAELSPARPNEATLAPQVSSINISIVSVLDYVKSTFENAAVLDRLPLEAAGNSGAWHAWRAYQGLPKAASQVPTPEPKNININTPKQPGEWNWEGVWEKRVRSGIEASLSDHVLFGGGGRTGIGSTSSETIRFLKLDENQLKEFREEMLGIKSIEATSSR